MIETKSSIYIAGIVACLIFIGCNKDLDEEASVSSMDTTREPALFTLLSPEATGIDFRNTLEEGLNTNIFMYEYFYNGGGVCAGDVNGDSLLDIYFTTNMGKNHLYLNQGNMQFREVSSLAGVSGRSGPWKTGATFVDINGDQLLDLYLCYSGSLPPEKRKNQLFINQGNNVDNIPEFSEEAEEYGLASPAYSNQAFFLDYDRDGDLDMLLLNHNPKSLPVLNEASTAELLKQDDPLSGIRLYRQDKGTFFDITVEAGVTGSGLSYGLGLGISDINQDGWPDFYLSNDYDIPDYLYINNGDGTFTNQIAEGIGHNSHFSMGNDIADINNDGWQDIFTLDMLPEDNRRQKLLLSPDNYAKFDLNLRNGFHYQYMRNMLQLNNGNGTFSEIGQLAGISNTDWSWSALFTDFDNDGWKDLYITNGYFRDYTNLDFINYMDGYVKSKGRLVREDVLELIQQMPSSNISNYIFANNQGKQFVSKVRSWGMGQPSNSNGAAYADLDLDGDLDLIVNNINQPAFIYQNQAREQQMGNFLQVTLSGEDKNTLGLGATVTISHNGNLQKIEQYNARGYLSSVSPVLHFGVGEDTIIDTLIVHWLRGKKEVQTNIPVNQMITLKEQNALNSPSEVSEAEPIFTQVPSVINFRHQDQQINDFDRQPLLISELSFDGPCMAKGDVNGDGLEDLIIGAARGQSTALYLQTNNGRFQQKIIKDFEQDKASVDSDIAIVDVNNDGSLDLYVASGGYHDYASDDPLLNDRLYINDGQGEFERKEDALPDMRVSKGCVAFYDMNADGYQDLFVGGRVIPGRYPETPESFLLLNDGSGTFTNEISSIAPELAKWGMITDAAWLDMDQNQTKELVIVGEWLGVTVYEKEGDKWVNHTTKYFDDECKGWWNEIAIGDVNNDSLPDLVIGNMGTNTQFEVSRSEPAEMYYGDFDNNGSVDPIFCYYIQGTSYPYVTRDEMLRQLVGLKSKFTSYESFADMRLTDIISPGQFNQAQYLSANHMKTTLWINRPNDTWQMMPLPIEVQYAPVYAIQVLDYDLDGNQDLLLCGNNNHMKLRLGKMDANYGTLLKGNGKGEFIYLSQIQSGLRLKGDIRSIVQFDNTLMFGINQRPVVTYLFKEPNKTLSKL